ncbi:uncharacterized protein LOC110445729 [Mizuhopecten yessoensis]|uniref:Uncharacterized protein n=1 Tax=Mizuhopecten yessoensis TaxID=6573 RepID=A0A210QZ56_MIZYE|nr:uncharacterized protein LOC110445729 [Mizuhopecten yessoensis]OWF54030.1 hypothetical protein KP79_PYT15291 [Mizuhopecten yessoensis]
MDIYNMAAFPRQGSPEWVWYQQMQVRMKHGQCESQGPTPADFQAFNLRPRGQGHPRHLRPRFIPTGQRSRGPPPPPYFMMNQHMVRNSTPQGMMNPRMYQPPVHMAGRPSSNPIEGLHELCNGPQRPSPPTNQCISPVNQRVSMDTAPRGQSPLSYMETSQALPVSQQGPPASSQVRSHLHPSMPQYISHSGMRMPVNSLPMMHPPPLMKVNGTLVQPMEQFSGPWTGQPGNVSFQPRLPYNFNGFPAGNRMHPDQISAQHRGQVPTLSVTTDNATNLQQTSSFQNTNFSKKDFEAESLNSNSDGTLSNSIFGRWYKPPTEDDEVKYDYIFDVDSETQTNEIDNDLENTKTSNASSHLIKRPSRLSNEKKGNKGKRLEGEISRIFSAFKAQLSPLGSDSLPESRTGFEAEPDTFSGRSSNNSISSDQSHSQAAQPGNNKTPSSNDHGNDNHLEKANNDTLPNVHTSQQQITCTTIPPMPPLMQAPMVYNPVTLQFGQQLLPPALTSLSTRKSPSLFQNQPNPPVVSHSGPISTSSFVSSENSTDHLSNPVTCSQEVPVNNIRILDTFSLSLPRESFVSDIVIQPQETNVNLNSSKSSSQANVGKHPENNNQVKSPTRKTSECDSRPNIVREGKKVTPLRIRLPFVLKSRLQEKLKKNSNKINQMSEKKKDPTEGTFQDTVSPVTDNQQSPATDSLGKPLEKCVEPFGCSRDKNTKGETVQDNVSIEKDSICTDESILPTSSLPTRLHTDSPVNNVDKLLPSDKNTHKGNSNDKPNDPLNLDDRLKEVVSKISSGRKRRKSAMLLESQPCTPDAKRRRLSKENELDSDVSCQKTVISKCYSLNNDEVKIVGEHIKQPDGTVITPSTITHSATTSISTDRLPSKQLCSRSNTPTVAKETVSETESASVQEPASDIHKEKPLENEIATDSDLPKIVRSPRLRKVRVSNRPWLLKSKEMDVADPQSKTGDLQEPLSKGQDKDSQEPVPMMDKTNDENLEKNKSDIERCQERSKSLCLKLRRISFPPSSSKDPDSKSQKKGSVNKVLEKGKKFGARNSSKDISAESLEKVVPMQESVHTENDSEVNLDGGVDKNIIGSDNSVDENMNNNNSGLSECVESIEMSTVVHMDSPIIEESTVIDMHTDDPVTVPDDGPITDMSTVTHTDSAVTEDSTAKNTDSPVKVSTVLKDTAEMREESDEIEVINISPKPKDTFDINIVNALFFPVTFHGSKALCISCLSGKYFVVRELLNKCFVDIAEKNRKKGVFNSKLFKQVYVAKERDLNIPYVELPEALRNTVGEYLVKEQLMRKSLVCHIGIIHVNDAKRLYHFFYGVKTCHDLKCVLPWPLESSKETTNQTDGNTNESRHDRLKSRNKDAVIDPPVIVVDNDEMEDTTSDPAENGVEIISCHVIYDREVDDTPDEGAESQEISETSKLSGITDKSSVAPAHCLKVPKVSPRNEREPSVKLKRRLMMKSRRERLSSGRRGDKSDLSDDSDATIPYMDETESDMECDKRKLSSSASDKSFGDTETRQFLAESSNKNSDVSKIIPIDDDNAEYVDLATVNSYNEDHNSDDQQQEMRIDPDQNEDYVVRGGIAELYDGMFRFLVINGRKFFPFEDLCQHYEKEDLINCLKSKPGRFKAIRCSMIETNFLNNLEPSLPTLVENATIIEEHFLHCSAKLNFRKMFDNPEQEVVDLTTDDDAVVPQRLADSPILTPEASPTLNNTRLSAFESFSTEDMLVDTSDDILMMELGTANCDTSGNGSVHAKVKNSEDDLSAIDGREQKAVADAFRDIWVENHSLKSKMAMMSQDIEETKKETIDFEATCQQYGDAIELMTKAIQQTCSEDQKKDLSLV